MYTNVIRRIGTSIAIMIAATLSVVAQAEAPRLPQPIFINGPANGATVTYQTVFDWTDSGADKFVLKFTIVETGQKLKHTINGVSCGVTDCEVDLQDTPLFDAVRDGQTVSWRVIAKYDDGKSKSTARTATADTVSAPATLLPANNAEVETGDVLIWGADPINYRYTIVAKDMTTGARAIKYHVLDSACLLTCAVNPHAVGDLESGRQYRWYVRAQGYNGEKAKSAKQVFVTPLQLTF